MYLCVLSPQFNGDVEPIVAAQWHPTTQAGADKPAGHAACVDRLTGAPIGVAVTRRPLAGPGVLGCHMVGLDGPDFALRVDEVAFPVGAIAHPHTHSGAGWRHLISGALRIETGDTQDIKTPGSRWFEPEDTVVRAVALQDTGITRFVRAMVIPAAFLGRSTFQLHRVADAGLPRLQITHQHVDHLFQVDAG